MFSHLHAKNIGAIWQMTAIAAMVLCLHCSSVAGKSQDESSQNEDTFFDETSTQQIDPTSKGSDNGGLFPLEIESSLRQPLVPVLMPDPSTQIEAPFSQDYFQRSSSTELNYWETIKSDHQIFYSRSNLQVMMVGLAFGGVLANTDIDTRFHQWQHGAPPISSNRNQLAVVSKAFGEGKYVFPALAGCYLLGELSRYEMLPVDMGPIGQWGQRGVRGVIVGLPVLGFGQLLTGASRPEELRGSNWRPFRDDNGISGHSFVGALPFLTAANMTDDIWAKSTLVFCSTLPAWSRLHDDAHYLSQTILGWGLAYWVCKSVSQSSDQTSRQNWRISLLQIDGGFGDQRSSVLGLSFELDY